VALGRNKKKRRKYSFNERVGTKRSLVSCRRLVLVSNTQEYNHYYFYNTENKCKAQSLINFLVDFMPLKSCLCSGVNVSKGEERC